MEQQAGHFSTNSIISDPNLEVQLQQSKFPGPLFPHYHIFFVFPADVRDPFELQIMCSEPADEGVLPPARPSARPDLFLRLLRQRPHPSEGLISFIYSFSRRPD